MVNIRRYDSPQVGSDPNRQAPQQLTQSPTAKIIGMAGQAAQIAYGEYERNQALAADDATAKLSLELKAQEENYKQLTGFNALRKLGEGGSFKMRNTGPAPEMVPEPRKLPTDPNAVAAKTADAAMSPAEQAQAKADQAKSGDAIETQATIEAMKDLSSGNSPYADHYRAIDDKVNELAKSLNGAARDRFLKDAWLRKEAFTLGVVSHQNVQQRTVAFSTAEAKVGGFMEIIHRAPDTAAARQAMADLADYTRDFQMKWNGLSGEALDAKVKSVVSTAKVREIESLMSFDKQKALAVLKDAQSGSMLTPEHEVAITKRVEEAASKAFVQTQADLIPPGTRPEDAIAWFNKESGEQFQDPDNRDRFRNLIRERFADHKQAAESMSHEAGAAVSDLFNKTKNPWKVINSSQMKAFMDLDPKAGEAAYLHYKGLAESGDKEAKMTPEQIWDWKSKFGGIIYDPDFSSYTQEKLKAITIGMPQQLRNHIQDTWQELKASGGKSLDLDTREASVILFKAGAIKSEAPKSDHEKGMVQEFIMALKGLSPAENRVVKWNDKSIQQYGARLAMKVRTENEKSFAGISYGGKEMPLFKVIELMPNDYYQRAVAVGARAGITVTKEDAARAWAEEQAPPPSTTPRPQPGAPAVSTKQGSAVSSVVDTLDQYGIPVKAIFRKRTPSKEK